ncbi:MULTISPECIES: GGDEF domain-containing protein [unclassified Vibrio]|uniref:GGDEF domain-containing protein n=1 Tax=unclassified Vibrio TaxID=2614977 RepID=UPI0009EF01EA|nr:MULTISPECIES: GGDEF domain-containing protein [unclassified Vibrio]
MPLWAPKSALLDSLEDIRQFRNYLLYQAPVLCMLVWVLISFLPQRNIYNILGLFFAACFLSVFHAALLSHSFTLAPISIILITALVKVTILKMQQIAAIYGSSIVFGLTFVVLHQGQPDIVSWHLVLSNIIILIWLLYLGQDHYLTQLRSFIHRLQQHKSNQKITMQMMQLEAQKTQLQMLLGRDALTGLFNRGYFDQKLTEEIQRASRSNSPLGLLVIDIDHFKMINDKLGHSVGDEYLQKVATVLSHTCRRETDTVARFGGEEFVILLPSTSQDGLSAICKCLLQAVADLELPHPIQPKLSISIGGCQLDNHNMDRTTFFKTADQALYQVKASGRNNFIITPT